MTLYVISDNTNHAQNPTIVVNRYSGSEEVFEAFSTYTEKDVTNVYRVDLQVTAGSDYWQDPETVASGYGLYEEEMGVTYRTFGSPVHIWKKSGLLYTDKGVLDPTGQALVGVKLFTSRKNDWNIFSAYKQQTGSDEKVIIRQMAP